MFYIFTRRSVFFSAVIAMACSLPASSLAQDALSQVQEHFLAAQQDQRQGRLDAAVQEYLTVLRLQPGIAEVYVNLGLVYYSQGKFGDSERALAQANRLKPGMRGVSLWLGIDYVKLDRAAQGAVFLRDAVRLDPTDKMAQSWLGTALWDAGQVDAALAQLRKATTLFPNDPDLLFARGEAYGKAASQETEELLEESSGTALSDRIYGDIYTQERNWTRAEGHLRRALVRDPRSVGARLQLAWVFFKQDRLAEAQQQLEQALALAPQSAAALARSGEVLLLMQQQDEGLSRIKKALAINSSEALDAMGLPADDAFDQSAGENGKLASACREAATRLEADPVSGPANQAALAALLAQSGDEDAAAQEYSSIGPIHSSPGPAAGRYARAMAAFYQHHYGEAEEQLVHWLEDHPRDLSARYELALTRRHLFMEQVIRLLTIAPDSYHVHQLLGQLYAAREEDNKALTEYLAVEAAKPDLPDVHFWLGHLYWKHGDADHAFAELTRELQLDPGHPEANGELGAVLVAEDRPQEAIPHLELAIRSKPDLWPAYLQLGRAYAMEKNYARAEAVLRHALAHDPDGSMHYRLAMVLRAEGKPAEATEVFAQVRAIKNEKLASPTAEISANE